ncbi:hypothetical protein BDQ12DRAFT_362143 [Crucibulum laeve]|uniref:F-box domain-containing protein n=1 Tax=Crucibulum laeve TaxID=68775 RepID=A0A5C3LPE3_9AGAR|nr:hypothetical protein BDQ12DRAFT_362143 [Crucibulum laeve]
MPCLDPDVLYAVVREVASFRNSTSLQALRNLALTCSTLRNVCFPVLFAEVHWPHANKNDEESGLLFFPDSLWPHVKHFRLAWPDHWADASPPQWGDKYYIGGDYNPRHMDKLVGALPQMKALTSFHISCPFFPPISLFAALIQSSVIELSINDTPLYVYMIPKIPLEFNLERLAIVPVAEALRVGEGPYDTKYHEPAYYVREYRKKYKNDILARLATNDMLFKVGKADALREVQVSGDLCTLDELAEHHWPNLDRLILTGHPPRLQSACELIDVLAKMPKLKDLRILFAKTRGDAGFRLIPRTPGADCSVLSQLASLALSNACILDGVLTHTTSLERLALVAIIDHPWVPIGFGRGEIDKVLLDLSASAQHLRQLRIMLEDKVNPELCHSISAHCPFLEVLEIELCGYHDGKSVFAWDEFAESLRTLPYIHSLRLCIQFPEFDEADRCEPWRVARKECAIFLAARVPTLRRVGFEYRKRTGTHRYEDSWLEYDVERKGGGGEIELFELVPTWYPFPEVWNPVSIVV